MRRSALVLVLAVVSACSDGTAPRDSGSDLPYLLTTTKVRVNGITKILVIPAQFSDGAPPQISAANLRTALFAGGTAGPIAKTYAVASEGNFKLHGDVAEWVKTKVSRSELGNAGTIGINREFDHVIEAIDLADPSVDFRSYDNDGPDGIANSGDDDGLLDGGIVVLGSDLNGYCNGGTGLGPHPHAQNAFGTGASRITYRTADIGRNGQGIGVKAYTLMSATECDNSTATKSTLAHELGHILFGLPDLYHIIETNRGPAELWKGRRWIVGCWELMAAGSAWGCGNGEPPYSGEPATFSAPMRARVGWTTPTTVSADVVGTYTLTAVGRGGKVLRVPLTTSEYFLIEYRQPIDGDLRIPGAGVLIHHVTESLPMYPINAGVPRQYRYDLVEADDDSSLVRLDAEGGNRGVIGDAFGNTVTAFKPGSHSEARTASGLNITFQIDNISIDQVAGTASVRIGPATSAVVATRAPKP